MLKKYHLLNNSLVLDERDETNIHVHINPDLQTRQHLVSTLNIDEHSISSALDPDEISRVEFKPDLTFIVWKHPENYSFQDEVRFNVSSVGLVLLRDRLVMILAENISLFDDKYPYLMTNNVDVVLNIFSQTTRHFLEHLKVIKQISREIQQKINTALENEYLIHMFTLGESLTYYLNAISSNAIVLTKIRNHIEKMGLSAVQAEFLDDIMIENNQCAKQAEIYSNTLSGLMDARGNLVNNNMNIILKNLTIINTIFLPLNLIASMGGMSEFSMMTTGIDWRISYSIFGLAMVVIGWMTAIVINKLGGWRSKKRKRNKLAKKVAPVLNEKE